MTQKEDRRQAQIDKGTAKANHTGWVKHTINLKYGSDLDMKFKMSPNKSHMVRHVFTRHEQMYAEIQSLLEENRSQREGIAKLQARLIGDRTNEDAIREMELSPGQTKFEVEEE